MAIFLTGGAGYIGSHTAVELLNSGMDVVIIDDFSNSSPESVKRIRELGGKAPVFYEGDAKDLWLLDRIFEENTIDAVIHFAGFKAVKESVDYPEPYYSNNLGCTLAILKTMKKHGVKKLIFSSSATVYGIPERVPLCEDAPVSCTNPYGWTKLMSEQILRDVCTADTAFTAVLLRYFNPVGAHRSGRIGESPSGIPNNLMPYISRVAAGKLERLSIFGSDYDTPDGTGVRDYIHISDLAKGHLAALKYANNHTGAEVFNLGTGKGYSVLEMTETFCRVNQVEVPYVFAERRDGDVASCWADPAKAEKLLGWKAEETLDDMVRDSWNWQKRNPNGYLTDAEIDHSEALRKTRL